MKPKGLLVFLHGYGSDPDYVLAQAGPFEAAGFEVLAPEAPDHGSRGDGGLSPDDWEALARHATVTVAAWVEELAAALPRWQAEHGLPLYAAGFSMGAYVWHELISRRLARPAAAALIGMGAIPNVPVPEGVELPIARAGAYPPLPLLQVHGRADPVVPLASVEKTLAALAPAYSEYPGRLALLALENAGHELTPEMAAMAAAWLARWRPDA